MDRPLERLKRSTTVENLWLYILSILKKRSAHGYKIMKEIERKFGIRVGLVTPYIVLYRLESDGYISSKVTGRHNVYTITEKGREILKKGKMLLRKTAAAL